MLIKVKIQNVLIVPWKRLHVSSKNEIFASAILKTEVDQFSLHIRDAIYKFIYYNHLCLSFQSKVPPSANQFVNKQQKEKYRPKSQCVQNKNIISWKVLERFLFILVAMHQKTHLFAALTRSFFSCMKNVLRFQHRATSDRVQQRSTCRG